MKREGHAWPPPEPSPEEVDVVERVADVIDAALQPFSGNTAEETVVAALMIVALTCLETMKCGACRAIKIRATRQLLDEIEERVGVDPKHLH